MKYIFEEKDINVGMIIKRDNSHEIEVLSWMQAVKNKTYYLSQINTDGLVYKIGDNKKEVAEKLNKQGYIPLKKEDVIKED